MFARRTGERKGGGGGGVLSYGNGSRHHYPVESQYTM